MSTTLLNVNQVSRSFDDGAGGKLDVLRGVSFTLDAGESLSIVGASGSGKSTLLNVLGGLDRPTAGSVELAGRDLASLDDAALARVRNESIGFVFQLHHLLPQCTVLENVLVPALVQGRAAVATAQSRGEQMLDRVGLGDRLSHTPSQLSGGERQRVAVVRALINQPALLLADEPTGALDHDNAAKLVDLLIELVAEQNAALVLVTHAVDMAQRTARSAKLHQGELHETASIAPGAPGAPGAETTS